MKKPDKDSPRRMSEETKGRLKNAAASAAGGIFIGAVSPLFMSMTEAKDDSQEKPVEATNNKETLSHPELVDDEVSVATGVSDDMSFGEAFAAARAEVGAGGVFEWHGGLYGTYYADEWNSMSGAEKAEYGKHFAWNNIDRTGSDVSHHSVSHTAENPSHEENSSHEGVNHTAQTVSKPDNIDNFEEEEDDIDIVSVTHDDIPDDEIEILGIMHEDPSDSLMAENLTDDIITIVNVDDDPTFAYIDEPQHVYTDDPGVYTEEPDIETDITDESQIVTYTGTDDLPQQDIIQPDDTITFDSSCDFMA